MKSNMLKVSKLLSLVLRHKPEVIGLKLDKYGYADLDELIEKLNTHTCNVDRAFIEEIVRTDDKQRYKIRGNKIRASQGHSIPVELELQEIIPTCTLYHGTAERFLPQILKEGLKKMNRNYVHLSADIETARSVGKRYGKPVILEIDENSMYSKGYTFYISENRVYLTDEVPPEFIKVIER